MTLMDRNLRDIQDRKSVVKLTCMQVFMAFQSSHSTSLSLQTIQSQNLSPHACSLSRYLDHEVFTEAPARLGAFLSQRTHVVFKAAKVLGEGHEEQSSQLEQQRIPGFLRPRRVLQRIRQNHTPASKGK